MLIHLSFEHHSIASRISSQSYRKMRENDEVEAIHSAVRDGKVHIVEELLNK